MLLATHRVYPALRLTVLVVLIGAFHFPSTAEAGAFIEHATVRISDDISLDFTARKLSRESNGPSGSRYGLSVFEGKLYVGAGGRKPNSILEKASVKISGKEINLDVSGLADPWFEKPRASDFHVDKIGNDYIVQACFSDGAEIYLVKWMVFSGRSIRVSIVHLGDDSIPWFGLPSFIELK